MRKILLLSLFLLTCHAHAETVNTVNMPRTELALEITCDVAPAIDIGDTPTGHRAIVPIIGGTFSGNDVKGTVLPGGADRQLIRTDGYKNLEARYELQTDDGQIISVINRVLTKQNRSASEPVFSIVELSAPEGKYAWINKEVYIGTLTSLRPARQAVLIRIFRIRP